MEQPRRAPARQAPLGDPRRDLQATQFLYAQREESAHPGTVPEQRTSLLWRNRTFARYGGPAGWQDAIGANTRFEGAICQWIPTEQCPLLALRARRSHARGARGSACPHGLNTDISQSSLMSPAGSSYPLTDSAAPP